VEWLKGKALSSRPRTKKKKKTQKYPTETSSGAGKRFRGRLGDTWQVLWEMDFLS
jgi:hypothetical protein